tara:strand:- start:7740 stop:8273 length:534 start_codon:yes stop_codon:yes gene_type:complete
MGAKIKLVVTLPNDLGGMLHESERTVLRDAGEDSVTLAQAMWVGWHYGRQYTPARKYPKSQRGTSLGAWKYRTNFTEQPFGIQIINNAKIKKRDGKKKNGGQYSTKSVGKQYAAYITRVGDVDPEWMEVWKQIKKDVLKKAQQDLLEEVLNNIGRDRVTKELRPRDIKAATEKFTIT